MLFISDSQNVIGSSSTERALLKHAIKRGYGDLGQNFDRLTEVPFSSERKFMSVQCRNRTNSSLAMQYVKGATEEILPRCKQFLGTVSNKMSKITIFGLKISNNSYLPNV